ncbi:MAG: zinc ribbon domain-containing protein [Candidatus Lokiarchaeota archaeon]|nr:zinc ribbon domain-containing protein [Candidatus Lokiarchaeota archaeon]
MKHKTGIILMIIGGALMIYSSAIGGIGVYEFLYEVVSNEVDPDLQPIIEVVLVIVRFIADWGGGAIIIGAFLIMVNQYRLGKWIIGIGLTFGSLALIVWLVSTFIDITGLFTDLETYLDQLEDFFYYGTTLQFAGVTTAIIGRWFIKKPKKEKKKKTELDEKETESTDVNSTETKHCPNCGVSLALNANFCNDCGTDFEDR